MGPCETTAESARRTPGRAPELQSSSFRALELLVGHRNAHHSVLEWRSRLIEAETAPLDPLVPGSSRRWCERTQLLPRFMFDGRRPESRRRRYKQCKQTLRVCSVRVRLVHQNSSIFHVRALSSTCPRHPPPANDPGSQFRGTDHNGTRRDERH